MGNPSENKTKTEQEDSDKGDEITDVLLIKEDIPPDLDKEDEEDVVYELVENRNASTKEDSETQASYAEQIEQLQQTQASMALDLEDAFAASDELARQLRKEKQTKRSSVTSYVALTIAGLGLIIAAAAAFFSGSLQREVTQLTATIERLEVHKHKGDEIKYLHARLDDLAIKIDSLSVKKIETPAQNKPNESESKPVSLKTDDKVVAKPKKSPQKIIKETVVDKKVVQKKVDEKKTEKPSQPAVPPALDANALKKKPVVVKPKLKKEWAVALGSYKNASTATKNARKYQQQGVPTTVIKVNAQGQVWHRLLTKAFVSQQEAARYASKVKAKLKIESVLVTKR
jgi:cell division septation protein DedD